MGEDNVDVGILAYLQIGFFFIGKKWRFLFLQKLYLLLN